MISNLVVLVMFVILMVLLGFMLTIIFHIGYSGSKIKKDLIQNTIIQNHQNQKLIETLNNLIKEKKENASN